MQKKKKLPVKKNDTSIVERVLFYFRGTGGSSLSLAQDSPGM